jgi:hypothetical protein
VPDLTTTEAAEALARGVAKASPSALEQIYAELFPEKVAPTPLVAADIIRCIRAGLAAEEIVDLWNVVFPEDHDVRYDEETKAIHFMKELSEAY